MRGERACQRDGLGRLVAKSEERASGLTRFEYGYDQAGRLVLERRILPDGSSLLTQWSYDGNGNRVSEMRPDGTVVSGAYDDQDRILAYGASTFTHTANGELLSHCQGSSCRHFDYDVFGNLRHVLLENGIEVEYVIDGRNRRVGTKVNGQLVQGFLYDDQLRIVAELDGAQQVVAKFIYADGINVPELMEKNGRTYRLLHDHLGSPRLVVDIATGEVAQELAYDAWGNLVFDSNPGFQPFGFAGGLHDPHTRLIRFGARDYDPHLGRWTAKDPILFDAGDTNLFAYAHRDPVGNSDATGLLIWVCNRKSFVLGKLQANHAYLWDTGRGGRSCGMQSSCGLSRDSTSHPEGGPAVDTCWPVLGSTGREELVMECCERTANRGLWFPFVNDCHSAVDHCLKAYGLWGEAPGGRLGACCA